MAYDFNGTNQYLQVSSAVVTAAPLTLACWFNVDVNNVTHALVSITNDGTAGSIVRFALFARISTAGGGVDAFASDTANTNGIAQSTAAYSVNTWHHGAGVFSSATSRTAYLDGGNAGTNTTNVTPTLLNRTNVGVQFLQTSGGTSGNAFCNGRIAEVGIWDVALTAQEIASLADAMPCDRVRPQNLVFYAPLVRDLQDVRGGLAITNNNTATVAGHPRVY